MNKFLLGSAAWLVLAAANPAAAADMGVARSAQPMSQVYNWTGFYLGANLGYGVAANPGSFVATQPGVAPRPQEHNIMPAGILGGVQAGYNWQASNWVLGFETDFQAADQKDSVCVLQCTSVLVAQNQTDTGIMEQRLSWFGTARGRVGLAVDRSLFYVTGGLAYAHLSTTATHRHDNGVGTSTLQGSSADGTRIGWTIGGGVEAALSGPWTAKVEYLYMDLGSQSLNFPHANFPNAFQQVVTTRWHEHVIRAGLNYRFGQPAGAVSAMPVKTLPVALPSHDWTGFYAGVNAGYGVGRNPTTDRIPNVGIAVGESFKVAPEGGLGGIQVGYNWQQGRWVLGLEADVQATAQQKSVCVNDCFSQAILTIESKLPWFGTARGRLGYADGALFYLTGGLAYGRVDLTETFSFFSPPVTVTNSTVHTGWTVGGGIEAPLAGNWTVKGEYLYLDLGSSTVAVAAPATTATVTSAMRDHVMRVGLNYRFGGPVVARY